MGDTVNGGDPNISLIGQEKAVKPGQTGEAAYLYAGMRSKTGKPRKPIERTGDRRKPIAVCQVGGIERRASCGVGKSGDDPIEC
jgi:hypothetical protein